MADGNSMVHEHVFFLIHTGVRHLYPLFASPQHALCCDDSLAR